MPVSESADFSLFETLSECNNYFFNFWLNSFHKVSKNYNHLIVIKFLISLFNNNFHRLFNNELCPCWTLEQMTLECKLSIIMPQFFSSAFWITAVIWERDPSCWSALMLQCWGSVCWGMHSVQVPQCAAAVELQVELWVAEPKARGHELLSLAQ